MKKLLTFLSIAFNGLSVQAQHHSVFIDDTDCINRVEHYVNTILQITNGQKKPPKKDPSTFLVLKKQILEQGDTFSIVAPYGSRVHISGPSGKMVFLGSPPCDTKTVFIFRARRIGKNSFRILWEVGENTSREIKCHNDGDETIEMYIPTQYTFISVPPGDSIQKISNHRCYADFKVEVKKAVTPKDNDIDDFTGDFEGFNTVTETKDVSQPTRSCRQEASSGEDILPKVPAVLVNGVEG